MPILRRPGVLPLVAKAFETTTLARYGSSRSATAQALVVLSRAISSEGSKSVLANRWRAPRSTGDVALLQELSVLVYDGELKEFLVHVQADVAAFVGFGHCESLRKTMPAGQGWVRSRSHFLRGLRDAGPSRPLPLRARSSTGWAAGAPSYDAGLEAHRHTRAGPEVTRPSTLSFCRLVHVRTTGESIASRQPRPGTRWLYSRLPPGWGAGASGRSEHPLRPRYPRGVSLAILLRSSVSWGHRVSQPPPSHPDHTRYDGEGNLIRKTNTVTGEVTEYTWDYRNRLTSVVHKDANGNVLWSESYVYDAFNRRIAFSEDPDGPLGPEPERFTFVLHDLAQLPTAEQVSQGGLAPYVDGVYASAAFAANPVADFVDGDTSDGITPTLTDRRLYGAAIDALFGATDRNRKSQFNLHDVLGSIRDWIATDGTASGAYTYDSFGTPQTSTSLSGGQRFGFTARPHSGKDSSLFLRARLYSSRTGRFVSADPAGFCGADTNVFRYVSNAPISYADPLGLFKIPFVGALAGRPVVVIVDSLGRERFVSGGKEFHDILVRIKEQGLSITRIDIKGHGGPGGISIGDGELLTCYGITICVGDYDVTDLLRACTGPGSQIALRGCMTAPLAERLAAALDGATVSGSARFSISIPCTRYAIYMPVYYTADTVPEPDMTGRCNAREGNADAVHAAGPKKVITPKPKRLWWGWW